MSIPHRKAQIHKLWWGHSFIGTRKATFTPLIMSVKANIFVQLLDALLPPVLEQMKSKGLDPTFIQDNAGPHVAKVTKKWL